MENILVSVVVPAYNIEAYIGRCLESILDQQHENLEIIVVNDGSTDKTGEVIDTYASKDKRVIPVHKENGGVSSARIAGVKRARGQYIGFVDGDDYIEPNMYRKLLENAIEFDAQISHCGYKMIFPDGRENDYYGTGEVTEQSCENGLKELLRGQKIEPSLGNKLYHCSVVKGVEEDLMWDSSIKINEDLLVNYLFFKKAKKSVYEDQTFYHYLIRKGSAATSTEKRYRLIDPLRVIKLIMEDARESEELYQIIYERYLRILIGIATQSKWKEDALEAKKNLKEQFRSSEIQKSCRSTKLKMMTFGVSYLYWVYKAVRVIYDKTSGVSKKFEV